MPPKKARRQTHNYALTEKGRALGIAQALGRRLGEEVIVRIGDDLHGGRITMLCDIGYLLITPENHTQKFFTYAETKEVLQ
ncbi:hypothetical protein CVU37_09150 [candidate division BRC1 bacterium HGW-BRC1-1]|jgi:hypothetical protein|nr:MAG: hypothetical protein CVU37_09150 [candidate division BRC1 bacterium HGW-BRC1-1]